MEEKLVPAHVHFVKWFIRIRWIAVAILAGATYTVRHILDIPVKEKPIFALAGLLVILNIFHRYSLNHCSSKEKGQTVKAIKKCIHFQIVTDLVILALILHFSGGIENPLFIFFFFHLIIASSIFDTFRSYFYAVFAIILSGAVAYLECFGIIPHYSLEGFTSPDLYRNILYISGTGFIFACTSVLIVFLSHMIINRSIKSEETYIRTNIELENKDKLKNEYVLRVTHDIKGHVAAIHSCVEVIKSKIAGPLNEVQEDFINRAFERTSILTEFIKNLLNLTRKRLRHDKEFEEFQLKDLIDKVLETARSTASEKKITVDSFIDSSAGTVNWDPYSIEELYSNLLSNAIKYTPPGGRVSLTVKRRQTNIISEVSDSGLGIPRSELSKVFDEFYRGSNVPKDMKTGTGLGLSIARQIVEDHKGRINVSSEEGVWTKFTFVIPVNPEENI